MSFLAPLFLVAAGGAALIVAALHLFARHRPPRRVFPTARFVPDRQARAASFAPKLTDRALMALRMAALLLLGAALARPVRTTTERESGRVVLADRSRSVADIGEVRDSVLGLLHEGDVLVAFADTARAVSAEARDSARSLERVERKGSLSAALAATGGAAREVADAAAVELVLVSPMARESLDAATAEIRAVWPGPIRLVPVRPREATPPGDGAARARLTVRGDADDPIAVAASLGGVPVEAVVRIVRAEITTADSAWARDSAGVLVHWPAASAPPGWEGENGESAPDAVVAGNAVLVAQLMRFGRPHDATTGTPVAWWLDGTPAALETALGEGCLRKIGIGIPGAGDLAVRPELRGLLAELAAPCGGARDWMRTDSVTLARIVGDGRSPERMELHRLEALPSPLVPWLLSAALACLLLELVMRRRRERVS